MAASGTVKKEDDDMALEKEIDVSEAMKSAASALHQRAIRLRTLAEPLRLSCQETVDLASKCAEAAGEI